MADTDDVVRRFVNPGDHVHLAGTPSRPNALTYALCRVLGERGRLTVSTTAVHSSAHAIALSGVADKVIASFTGDTYPSPRPNPLYRDLPRGEPFAFEAWSLLSYVQRLMAGALGLPYAVTGSLAGTGLAEDKADALHSVPDPARPDRQVTLLTPLRPDVTLIHGVCADEDGNIALVPPLGEGVWAAYGARRGVLASVERIVSRAELRAFADRVVIPGQRVLGLCEAPFGAHPQSLRTGGVAGVHGYLDDYEFLSHIVESCASDDRGAGCYHDWVARPGSHAGYLRKLGPSRLDTLDSHPQPDGADEDFAAWERITRAEMTEIARAREDGAPTGSSSGGVAVEAPPAPGPVSTVTEAEASTAERMIVLGARAVTDRVRQHGYDTVLAGIGTSHIAAWLAAALLRREGQDITVVAELGASGFTPAPGDDYLFSLAHAERSQMLAGMPEILGGMVAANPRALGVLAAAEIDQTGAINTSQATDGHWLTGSGGANDIASTTDCVVIAKSSSRRYVTETTYRTSPGHRVCEVVSDFGRFHRTDDGHGFRLATLLPDDPAADHIEQQARDLVARRTSWTADVAGLIVEDPPSREELALLRSIDPNGHYR